MKIYYLQYLIFITAACFVSLAKAQNKVADTTILLKPIMVEANKLVNFSSGIKINFIDSISLKEHNHQNLSDLLIDESPIFIKTYGLGALATSSFRGSSANHTAVLWNGFNINSPMNGQMDLSLVPVSFANNIAIQYGGNGALWGSGAVAGAIHLTNKEQFNSGTNVKLNFGIGSFNTYNQQASVLWSKQHFITALKLFSTSAKNNFSYRNSFLADSPTIKQSNAELISKGALLENYLQLSSNQFINLFLWYQNTDRNIPPTMLQPSNSAKQVDASYRISSEWKFLLEKQQVYLRAAYFDEALTYEDKTYNYLSLNAAKRLIAEAETKLNLNPQHLLQLGINNTFASAIANGYAQQVTQNRTALFLAYKYTSKAEKLNSSISLRQELIKNQNVPFTFSGGVSYKLLKTLMLQTNLSRVYRIPTFNDLYWNPGGNPNLLPEQGYSEELGLQFNKQLNKSRLPFLFSTEATIFNRNINNWIIWLPSIDYWSPQNLMQVWSRGLETNSKMLIKWKEIKITLSAFSNYVLASNQQAKFNNDASVNKQLIYVPMYSGHAKTNIEYKNIGFSYRHSYTGYRYTATDNTEYLLPFFLGAIYLSYSKQFKHTKMACFMQINNIWNQQYQVLLSRAMPQQNANLGISFEFNNPNNKQ